MKRLATLTLGLACLPLLADLRTTHGSDTPPEPTETTATPCRTAVDPKPLSADVKEGLDWLVANQHDSGGWGQGDESANMGGGGALKAVPNVADTCVAALALIRSDLSGSFADSLHRAVEFVCREIEAADADSLSITSVNGTRVQGKLGPHVDTFLASVVLAEASGHLPDEAAEQRRARCLDKVLHKIVVNQKQDGTWDNNGWAPVLAQSMAAKGLNKASQLGVAVDADVLVRAEGQAKDQVVGAGGGGGFAAPGSAGVALYSGAANLSTLQDSVNSNRQREADLRETAKNAPTVGERDEARRELERFEEVEAACELVQTAVIKRLDDEQFVAGFGSNGGEEFLSYMNIGESLVLAGGDTWKKWDESITANLNRIQNADGSWTGHHCITGRTFCTASALLVLMVDRTPFPAEAMARAE